MSDDLVERLRAGPLSGDPVFEEAADEIERLRKALNEALNGWESAPPDDQDDLERIKEIRETQ